MGYHHYWPFAGERRPITVACLPWLLVKGLSGGGVGLMGVEGQAEVRKLSSHDRPPYKPGGEEMSPIITGLHPGYTTLLAKR